jgi:hypothetical protein
MLKKDEKRSTINVGKQSRHGELNMLDSVMLALNLDSNGRRIAS